MQIPGVFPDMPTNTLIEGLTELARDLMKQNVTMHFNSDLGSDEVLTAIARNVIIEAAIRLANMTDDGVVV